MPPGRPKTVARLDVTAAGLHACALLGDGTIQCWGGNDTGSLGNGTMTDSSIPGEVLGITNTTVVAAGSGHTCAALSDGTVQCWGDNYEGQLGNATIGWYSVPVTVVGITSVTAVAAGDYRTPW